MTKKKLTNVWHKAISISPWYLLILAVISAVICIFALRGNYEHMTKLRQDVYTADQNNGNVTAALTNLQKYVTAHMNTNLTSGNDSVYPPIQLKNTYDKQTEAIGSQLQSVNSNIYTEAEDYCQNAIPNGFSGRYRVPCIEQYIESHSLNQGSLDQSLYEFDFVSPTWSPDLAGWSLVTTIFLVILFLVRLIIKYLEKRRRSSAS